jgi:K+-sensing histidine kinase KdpD
MRPTKINSIIDYAISDVYEDLTNKKLKISLPKAELSTEIIIEPDLIKEVIEIFLSNAIMISQPNSTIALEIAENETSIVLTVNYPCQGVHNEEFIKINEYIASDLKIQRTNWPGIRLSIAKFIMDIHNAEIKIFDHTGAEAQINMIFPINNAKRNALHQLLSQLN